MTEGEDPIVTLSRERIENGSKSFAAAARLLPPDVRASTYMLYAWCRYCDDAIDGQELGFVPANGKKNTHEVASEIVDDLRHRTVAASHGEPDGPVFEALSRVLAKHDIPEVHPLELIDGFAMDANGRTYETIADTIHYSYHVAGVVGLMMARVMGVSEVATLRRASDLGIAFQLTNIARDVMDDAARGRIYLPLDWLAEAGVPAAQIKNRAHRQGVAQVAKRLLAEADRYYSSAVYGIAALPARTAMSIAAARAVYRAIGTKVRARGDQAWDERTVISRPYKLATLALSPLHVAQAKASSLIHQPTRDGLWTHPALAD